MKIKSCLAFLCIFAMLLPIGATAEENVSAPKLTMEITGDTATKGSTFTVTVDLENNPGFFAGQFDLTYDKEVMRCDSITNGALLGDMLTASNPNAKAGAKIAASSATDVEGDGTFATFTFTVLKDNDAELLLKEARFGQADGTKLTVHLPQGEEPQSEEPQGEEPQGGDQPSGGNSGSGGGSSSGGGGSSVKPKEDEPTMPKDPTERIDMPKKPTFTDVPRTFWGYVWIEKAAAAGYIKGESEGIFAPDASMTRAAFVTMLWRRAGEPAVKYGISFTDVEGGAWYEDAVRWAAAEKIVNGTDETHFAPDEGITRAQIAAILFRESGAQVGLEGMLASTYAGYFVDSAEIEDWAKNAVNWAIYHEILGGTDEKKLEPNKGASRAEVATMLMRYCEKVSK